MKKIGITLLGLTLMALMLCGTAEARRLGGGGSFGGRPGYSRGYSPSMAPAPGPAPSRMGQGGGAGSAPMSGSGMGRRVGWGMGGLLTGGLLGSMFLGRGMGGLGGGVLDFVLIGFVVWIIVRFMSRRDMGRKRPDERLDDRPENDMRRPEAPPRSPDGDQFSRAEHSWDALRTRPKPPAAGAPNAAERPATPPSAIEQTPPSAPAEPAPEGAALEGPPPEGPPPDRAAPDRAAPAVPEGFNVPEFLEGAKTVYARLQRSWDRRDLDDLARFTTPEVFVELKRQAEADPGPSQTELMLVKARLLDFREETKDTVASVFFDVLLREDPAQNRPVQAREVWHFSRPTGDFAANWRLEGIQQVEA